MRLGQFLLYAAMALAVALPGSALAEDPDAGGEVTGPRRPPVAEDPDAGGEIAGRTTAQSSSVCDKVFARLRAAPSVSVWWTTNYFANGVRFMGVTAIELRLREGDLVGQGRRAQISPAAGSEATDILERRPGPARPAAQPETVTLRIRADGKVMLNDRYGPYVPVCWSDRFAGFHSGDSVETFNFKLP